VRAAKRPMRALRRRRLRCRLGGAAALPRADDGGSSESPNEASESVKWSRSPYPSPGDAPKGAASGSRELARSTREPCAAAATGGKLGKAELPVLRAASASSTSSAQDRREQDPGSMDRWPASVRRTDGGSLGGRQRTSSSEAWQQVWRPALARVQSAKAILSILRWTSS
jgi:hypothetical protein